MKVTQVALRSTEASDAAGRPALTPELLAASGARYSRSNDGLEAILAKIDPHNLDKSVDSIFRMIDYGHQSIADMVPVSMFIDGVSLWLAYYVWTLCPTAGGQESSTRYIKLDKEGLIASELLGIPDAELSAWQSAMAHSFEAYSAALKIWERLATEDPDLARIPKRLTDDPTDKAQKQVARMRRNYGFDRARYFLPVAAATNLMLVMSARAWVLLCQTLLSHPLPEAQHLGRAIHDELTLCAPRMLRHAVAREPLRHGMDAEWQSLRQKAAAQAHLSLAPDAAEAHPSGPSLQVMPPAGIEPWSFPADLAFHDNRYGWIGPELKRTSVRFSWEAMALAEIRDLNRHRTGNKYCPLIPQGFYAALDQIPEAGPLETLQTLWRTGQKTTQGALDRLIGDDPGYVYWTLLGTQYPFEHVTTADKFIYEAELRTGTGAHYRYAEHMHEILELWYARFPETRGLILEGSAEPE